MGSARPDPLIGQVVAGRYEVTRLIGKGGMGAVYEVRHVKLRKRFALKRLAAALVDDAEALARFQREADVVARFRHPNVVEVVDWETLEDGSPCMIMEYLDGEDLAQRLRRVGPLPWPAIAEVCEQVLSGLAVAHRAGVIHRDLKPQNIFIARDDTGEERCKLLDFGVSKIRHADSLMTGDDRLLGTPAYMAPEQADGRPDQIGPATDCWAFGAIVYELATGRQAFHSQSTPSTLYKICHGAPEPLAVLRPDAPPDFVTAVEEALSRDSERRLTSVDVLRRSLRSALAPLAPGVIPNSVEQERTEHTVMPEFQPASEIPTSYDEPPQAPNPTTLSSAIGQRPATGGQIHSKRSLLVLGSFGGAALLGGVVVLLSIRSAQPPTPAPTTSLPPPAPAVTAPAAAPSPTGAPPPALHPAVTPPSTKPGNNDESKVLFVLYPRGAAVTLDGKPWTGHVLERPEGNQRRRVVATKPGFLPAAVVINASSPREIEVIPQPKRPAPRPKSVKPAPARPKPSEHSMQPIKDL